MPERGGGVPLAGLEKFILHTSHQTIFILSLHAHMNIYLSTSNLPNLNFFVEETWWGYLPGRLWYWALQSSVLARVLFFSCPRLSGREFVEASILLMVMYMVPLLMATGQHTVNRLLNSCKKWCLGVVVEIIEKSWNFHLQIFSIEKKKTQLCHSALLYISTIKHNRFYV